MSDSNDTKIIIDVEVDKESLAKANSQIEKSLQKNEETKRQEIAKTRKIVETEEQKAHRNAIQTMNAESRLLREQTRAREQSLRERVAKQKKEALSISKVNRDEAKKLHAQNTLTAYKGIMRPVKGQSLEEFQKAKNDKKHIQSIANSFGVKPEDLEKKNLSPYQQLKDENKTSDIVKKFAKTDFRKEMFDISKDSKLDVLGKIGKIKAIKETALATLGKTQDDTTAEEIQVKNISRNTSYRAITHSLGEVKKDIKRKGYSFYDMYFGKSGEELGKIKKAIGSVDDMTNEQKEKITSNIKSIQEQSLANAGSGLASFGKTAIGMGLAGAYIGKRVVEKEGAYARSLYNLKTNYGIDTDSSQGIANYLMNTQGISKEQSVSSLRNVGASMRQLATLGEGSGIATLTNFAKNPNTNVAQFLESVGGEYRQSGRDKQILIESLFDRAFGGDSDAFKAIIRETPEGFKAKSGGARLTEEEITRNKETSDTLNKVKNDFREFGSQVLAMPEMSVKAKELEVATNQMLEAVAPLIPSFTSLGVSTVDLGTKLVKGLENINKGFGGGAVGGGAVAAAGLLAATNPVLAGSLAFTAYTANEAYKLGYEMYKNNPFSSNEKVKEYQDKNNNITNTKDSKSVTFNNRINISGVVNESPAEFANRIAEEVAKANESNFKQMFSMFQ